jgi:phospholipid N-methyltransferase
LILGHFVRHPGTVGTVTPSSARLAHEMVRALEPGRAETVVELGPGTGAFTEAIVECLAPAGHFLAVELEPAFVAQLRSRFPALDVVCASATDLATIAREHALGPVDHIVSGLPFASLPSATSRQVLDAIERVLRPGGTFTTFQYVHAYALPRAVAFRHDMDARMGGRASRTMVGWNVPPAFVLSWRLEQDRR